MNPIFQKKADEAHAALVGGDLVAAERLYSLLLNAMPDHPGFLYHVACICLHSGRTGLAFVLFNYLIEKHPDIEFKDALWNNLALCHKAEGREKLAEAAFMRALEVEDPIMKAEVYHNLAALNIQNGNPRKCIEYADQALALKSIYPQASWNKALGLLELSRWREGFRLYESEFRGKQLHRSYWEDGKTYLWTGKRGQTVVLHGEQGLGDEIMFAQCVPEAIDRCKKVILHVAPRLEGLFRRSFPKAVVYGGHEKGGTAWQGGHEIDACLPIGSLCHMFRNEDKDFWNHQGYMKADPVRMGLVMKRLEALPRPWIGLSWMGGVKQTGVALRTIMQEDLAGLLKAAPTASWISLQWHKEYAREDADALGIHHWPEIVEAKDMDETAALIACLDLVITVNNTNVHLAGALDKPCWTMTSSKPSWRYGFERSGKNPPEKMIWYPHAVRQFRQPPEEKEWKPTVERVATELKAWLTRWQFTASAQALSPRPTAS